MPTVAEGQVVHAEPRSGPEPGFQKITRAGLAAKHALDFTLALIGTILTLPVFLLVGALIKLDSKGPVFFRQKRIGQAGRPFHIFKFRTMVDGAYKMGSRLTVKRDPRITRVGAVLRWSKLDELPQLLNVLRGEMSLIGPRPEDPYFVERYTAEQRQVLRMRPGLLGPSQIEGRDEVEDYPEGIRDTESFYVQHILPPKLERDLNYVRTTTFAADLGILVHGVWATVRGAFRLKYLWRRRRRLALIGADMGLALASYWLALTIRFDNPWPDGDYVLATMLLITLVRPLVGVYFGVYHGLTRYFGHRDLLDLFKAVASGSILVASLVYFAGMQDHPRSVFVIDAGVLLFLQVTSRLAMREWVKRHRHRKAGVQDRVRALIVGAGSRGEQIGRALMEDPTSGFRPVGYIDDSPERWGSRIHGVKVLGGTVELPLAISANEVRVVFVCLSDLTDSNVREVSDICAEAAVDCRIVPGLSQILQQSLPAGPSLEHRGPLH